MKAMSCSESRAHYSQVLNSVIEDREEVIATRTGRESVVIVSLDEYNFLKETVYLMRSPENARRPLNSMGKLEVGRERTEGSFNKSICARSGHYDQQLCLHRAGHEFRYF